MHRVIHTDEFPMTENRNRPANISNNAPFYNFFYLMSNSQGFINKRWLAINVMDQKFYRMFMSSTMQQRIYTN